MKNNLYLASIVAAMILSLGGIGVYLVSAVNQLTKIELNHLEEVVSEE